MHNYPVIAANWKMNPRTRKEALELWNSVKQNISSIRNIDPVVFPPLLYLPTILDSYSGSKISLGAQDVFWEEKGSFTGEVSAPQVRDLGAHYILVGHSERRALGESDFDIRKKIDAALRIKGLQVIVCVGERERDISSGSHLTFLSDQLTQALKGIAPADLSRVTIAYEPVWAIGKSAQDAMNAHEVYQMSLYIRKVLDRFFDRSLAMKMKILYGGSVERSNSEALLRDTDMNGFLVGHASLDADHFADICRTASTIYSTKQK